MKALIRLVGIAVVVFGLGLAGAALLSDAAELQVLFGIFAMAGLLIVLVGGALIALSALWGRGKAKGGGPRLTPEQQQILDSREFQAAHRGEQAGE
ncbi:hypothetical protein CU669_18480 [Paramagnetospirillum kuznetsovii]|uniref:Uncharacterized protein n=1 Tax=Paramagnetospirillum kuznetsovii TaxID=2053833 RepID=A0A364NTP1_9PROT|nr:hypothetical protein [Paramagnetospirillum kuznetsovii]RAU20438.1 hypothetical protein CU669_18480 [Paramagnetospirillum kuznetsovii]